MQREVHEQSRPWSEVPFKQQRLLLLPKSRSRAAAEPPLCRHRQLLFQSCLPRYGPGEQGLLVLELVTNSRCHNGDKQSVLTIRPRTHRVWRETWSTALALKAQSAASRVKTRMEIFKKLPETQLRGRYLACNSRVETSASTWRAVSSF